MAKYGICSKCGEKKKLDTHHRDGNHDNDVVLNRAYLCSRCHHLAHADLNLIKTGRPGTKPLSERAPEDFPRIPKDELRRQYEASFPKP